MCRKCGGNLKLEPKCGENASKLVNKLFPEMSEKQWLILHLIGERLPTGLCYRAITISAAKPPKDRLSPRRKMPPWPRAMSDAIASPRPTPEPLS